LLHCWQSKRGIIIDPITITGSLLADTILTNAAIGAGTSALTGGDPLKGGLIGGITGGIAGAPEAMGSSWGSLLGQGAKTAAQAEGSAGALLSSNQLDDAIGAYVKAGYTPTEAASLVDKATGNALGTAESMTGGQLGDLGYQVADQGAFNTYQAPSIMDYIKGNQGSLGTVLSASKMMNTPRKPIQGGGGSIIRGNQIPMPQFEMAKVQDDKKRFYSLLD